jgi:hypothetical protein
VSKGALKKFNHFQLPGENRIAKMKNLLIPSKLRTLRLCVKKSARMIVNNLAE